jgi:hypothetical protein
LNAVSVGFIPLRWENGGPGDHFRRRYLEQELLEVSAVGIPANPEALQLGLKSGAFTQDDFDRVIETLDALASPVTDPTPRCSAGCQPAVSQVANLRTSESARAVEASADRQSAIQPLSLGSSTAPDTHVGASGVPGSEAPLLQLARDFRRLFGRG